MNKTAHISFLSVFLSLTLLPGLSSCSVKENRLSCPSFIIVTLLPEGGYQADEQVSCHIFDAEGIRVAGGTYPASDYLGEDVWFSVKKDQDYTVTCVSGVETMERRESQLLLPQDGESDRLWAFSKGVRVGDSDYGYNVTGRLSKAYADLTLRVVSPQDDYPFRFVVRTTTEGLSLVDLSAVTGGHRYYPVPTEEENTYSTRICHQDDIRNIVLDIYRRSDESYSDLLHTVPLGRDLLRAGYDPYTVDMEDIVVDVTYAEGGLHFRIGDWEVVYEGELEI